MRGKVKVERIGQRTLQDQLEQVSLPAQSSNTSNRFSRTGKEEGIPLSEN